MLLVDAEENLLIARLERRACPFDAHSLGDFSPRLAPEPEQGLSPGCALIACQRFAEDAGEASAGAGAAGEVGVVRGVLAPADPPPRA